MPMQVDVRDTVSISGSGRRAWQRTPLQYSSLENPMDRGAWQATVHSVAQSQTWLKWLSMHTCMHVTLIDLCILKNPCIPGTNPSWSWCVIFLMCCWIQLARILLRIFVSIFIQDWRREWLPTSVFLPGEFHGQRSLVGFSPRGCKESDMTEWLSFTFISCLKRGKIYFHLGLTNTVKNHFPRIYKVTGSFLKCCNCCWLRVYDFCHTFVCGI